MFIPRLYKHINICVIVNANICVGTPVVDPGGVLPHPTLPSCISPSPFLPATLICYTAPLYKILDPPLVSYACITQHANHYSFVICTFSIIYQIRLFSFQISVLHVTTWVILNISFSSYCFMNIKCHRYELQMQLYIPWQLVEFQFNICIQAYKFIFPHRVPHYLLAWMKFPCSELFPFVPFPTTYNTLFHIHFSTQYCVVWLSIFSRNWPC